MSRSVWDAKLAIRHFAKTPLTTGVVIATLALCIGANSAIFSVIDALLLRPLPVEQPQRLVWITNTGAYGTEAFSPTPLFSAYTDRCSVCDGVLAFVGPEKWSITRAGTVESAQAEIVSGSYFAVLGVRPFFGRTLTTEDERSHNPVAVISFNYWKHTFESSPTVIGQVIRFGDNAFTIVGVTPPEFFGTVVGSSPDLFVPLAATPALQRSSVVIMGRLKPGVTLAQAQSTIEPLFEEFSAERIEAVASRAPQLAPLIRQLFVRSVVLNASNGISQLRIQIGLSVRILMCIVALVLLIGCVNLASLLFMRGIQRRKEFAVRTALGATRWDLSRSVLTEGFLLVVLGTLFGLILAKWMISYLVASFANDRIPGAIQTAPVMLSASLDFRVLLFTAFLVTLTIILCSLTPALISSSFPVVTDLRLGGNQAPRKTTRFGLVLATAQVAMLVILLLGATALLRSFVNLETANVGFDADHVLVLTVKDSQTEPADQAERRFETFYAQFSTRATGLPGVLSVSSSATLPMSGTEGAPVDVVTEGRTEPRELHPDVFYSWVSPRYFETLGIPLLRGRDFTSEDSSLSVSGSSTPVIVNRRNIFQLFVEKTMRLAVIGSGVGLVVALALAGVFNETIFGAKALNLHNPGTTGASGFIHIEKGFLFGVKINDPALLVFVLAAVFAVSLAASCLPAIRAARVEPTIALKTE
jgi:predicted permease